MSGRQTLKLVLGPSLLALAVTLLRLVGELRHWSQRWFSPETGGVIPRGTSWVFGITWLAVPFGVYFAFKLARTGMGPTRPWRVLAWAFAGMVVVLAGLRLVWRLPVSFPPILVFVWLVMTIGAALAWVGSPALARTLLVYGLASRLPVAVVMFLAMRGSWGTHYDYVGMPAPFQMPLWPRFLWLAVFPQLVFWVGFTVLVGTLAGALAMAIFFRPRVS